MISSLLPGDQSERAAATVFTAGVVPGHMSVRGDRILRVSDYLGPFGLNIRGPFIL